MLKYFLKVEMFRKGSMLELGPNKFFACLFLDRDWVLLLLQIHEALYQISTPASMIFCFTVISLRKPFFSI